MARWAIVIEEATYRPGQEVPGTVYRVVKHLATGGMGTVYEVEDVSVEKRYVLKTLHPQLLAREDLARRMKDEAKILARLRHPNIVDVVTAGVTQDRARVPYYVMERLVGYTLRHILDKKGSLELVYALRVAIDVLDALDHAHEHGIIHRDVKPENIFLHQNQTGTTTTKLLDFGIMRLVDAKSNPTRGKFVGTIRYASPEQVVGDPLDGASDVYALGLVLYEMIAGRGPFDDLSEGYAIGMAHVNRAPKRLSELGAVPPEIDALVMSALAKKPSGRPRDAFAFAEDLRRLMPGGPLTPRAPRVSTPVAVPAPPSSDPMAFLPTELPARTSAVPVAPGRRSPSLVAPIVLASVFAIGVVGAAVLWVVRPWARDAASSAAPLADPSVSPAASPAPAGASASSGDVGAR